MLQAKGAQTAFAGPKTLYGRYQDCLQALDDEWLSTLYRKMPESERAGIAFDDFKAKQVLDEIRLRNGEWLNRGIPGCVSQEPAARPLPKEIAVAKWLSFHGFDVEFRETRSAESKKTSDIYIGRVMWEIKQPTGAGKQTIYHQFEEAALQCNRLVLDVSQVIRPEAGARWNIETVKDAVRKLIGWHYKGQDGQPIQFAEVLMVDGMYLKRFKKGS